MRILVKRYLGSRLLYPLIVVLLSRRLRISRPSSSRPFLRASQHLRSLESVAPVTIASTEFSRVNLYVQIPRVVVLTTVSTESSMDAVSPPTDLAYSLIVTPIGGRTSLLLSSYPSLSSVASITGTLSRLVASSQSTENRC